jgi:hypothetical protein
LIKTLRNQIQSLNGICFVCRKKVTPTVAELLKQQGDTSLSQTNGITADLDLISPSSNDDSSQDAQNYDERIDAVIDSVIAMGDSDRNIESMIDNPLGFNKDDSNSKDYKVIDEASAPKLPQNMPKDLEETIKKLKKVIKSTYMYVTFSLSKKNSTLNSTFMFMVQRNYKKSWEYFYYLHCRQLKLHKMGNANSLQRK